MALDKKNLRTRSITAVVFALVMLAGLFINGYTFTGLFLIIMAGCIYEVLKIVNKIEGRNRLLYIIYASIPMMLMIDLGFGETISRQIHSREFPVSAYYFLYPVAVILSIWINDTMAYIVGSMIGKTPFSKISPKKTWEGTVGGAILCVAVMALLGYFIPALRALEIQHWIAIAAISAIAGTIGDLFESKLKRMANIKDSGSFMPGHGGFLDRFDSLLFAAPFVWLYIHFFVL